jgi:hypothetical protein
MAGPAFKPRVRKMRAPAWPWPWEMPGTIEDADVYALQALARGEANASQQKRCLELIGDKLCQTERMSFYPGADDGRRASDFAEGRRWVGIQMARILRMRPARTQSQL